LSHEQRESRHPRRSGSRPRGPGSGIAANELPLVDEPIPFLLARSGQALDSPQKKQQLRQEGQLEGRLTEARAALRRVLVGRQLTPSPDDDARIDACTDLTILERWLDRAITATRVSDVLR
jgi:hypothetical protein